MRVCVAAMAIWAAVAGGASAQTLTAEETKAGFVSLFNGKDFSGWRFTETAVGEIPKNWSVEDGVMRLHGGGKFHLASEWDYDDFEVRFQWKPHKTNYNSGFYVRSGRKVGANQINLAMKAAGNLMGAKGGPGVPELQLPPGQWNEWKAVAEGEKLTFWCNEKQAWAVTGFKPARGYLGLQAEGAAIDFKNFRVREFGAVPAPKGKTTFGKASFVEVYDEMFSLVVPKESKENYSLRFEIRGAIQLQVDGDSISTTEGEFAKAVYPAKRWNYVQVTATGGQTKIWINGTESAALAKPGRTVSIVPVGATAIQNVRVRPMP